jgi:hypothetical protein
VATSIFWSYHLPIKTSDKCITVTPKIRIAYLLYSHGRSTCTISLFFDFLFYNEVIDFVLKGMLAKKQFSSKSQVVVYVKLFQRFNAGYFTSAILGFQISHAPPCLFLQSLMGNYDIIALLDVFKTQHCVNLEI